jgi:acyl carrier protein
MIDKISFLKLIAKILKEDIQNVHFESKVKDFVKWDSLTTINIFLELKKKYNLNINLDIPSFKTLEELYEQINKKN